MARQKPFRQTLGHHINGQTQILSRNGRDAGATLFAGIAHRINHQETGAGLAVELVVVGTLQAALANLFRRHIEAWQILQHIAPVRLAHLDIAQNMAEEAGIRITSLQARQILCQGGQFRRRQVLHDRQGQNWAVVELTRHLHCSKFWRAPQIGCQGSFRLQDAINGSLLSPAPHLRDIEDQLVGSGIVCQDFAAGGEDASAHGIETHGAHTLTPCATQMFRPLKHLDLPKAEGQQTVEQRDESRAEEDAPTGLDTPAAAAKDILQGNLHNRESSPSSSTGTPPARGFHRTSARRKCSASAPIGGARSSPPKS